MAQTDLRLSHCMIQVDDQDAALTFYRDVLGFEVRADVPFPDGRWLTVGPPSQPEIEILLETPDMGRSPADRDAMYGLMARGSLNTLIFVTEDCDATYERLRAAGAQDTQKPTDQPYGVRDCAFRDPAGNHIRFSELRAG